MRPSASILSRRGRLFKNRSVRSADFSRLQRGRVTLRRVKLKRAKARAPITGWFTVPMRVQSLEVVPPHDTDT